MYQAAQNRYNTLPTRRCGNSGLLLPAVSLGLWHNFGDTFPYENMRALCRTAFDNGITHFDLANNYGPEPGAAERNFGRILHDDLGVYRDELIISTKAGYEMWDGPYGNWGSRKYLLASLDQSLRRMGLDYVDIFYHHRMDPNTPLEETMGALAQAIPQQVMADSCGCLYNYTIVTQPGSGRRTTAQVGMRRLSAGGRWPACRAADR